MTDTGEAACAVGSIMGVVVGGLEVGEEAVCVLGGGDDGMEGDLEIG